MVKVEVRGDQQLQLISLLGRLLLKIEMILFHHTSHKQPKHSTLFNRNQRQGKVKEWKIQGILFATRWTSWTVRQLQRDILFRHPRWQPRTWTYRLSKHHIITMLSVPLSIQFGLIMSNKWHMTRYLVWPQLSMTLRLNQANRSLTSCETVASAQTMPNNNRWSNLHDLTE